MKAKLLAITVACMLLFGLSETIQAAQDKPVELSADTIEYNSTTGVMIALGSVRMTQDNAVMTGAKAEYNTKSKEAWLTGGVQAVKDKATLVADQIHVINDNHMIASGGEVVLTNGDSRITGPQIDYYSDKQYAVVDGWARLTMPDGWMTANKVETYMAEDRAIGTGNVHLVSDVRKLDATADQITYFGQKTPPAKAVLTGNARAVQDGNVLTGNVLTIYLDDKAIDATGRSKLVVLPE